MIVHCFICRNDEWILPYHLNVYSTFCDRIVCLVDRSPASAEICKQFPKVEVHQWSNRFVLPDFDENGALCEEGEMRQAAWDIAAESKPDWIVLGDTDETPTPDIAEFLKTADRSVDLWYADWVNLVYGMNTAIGGQLSPWSFQKYTNNKKGLIVRWRPHVNYRYAIQHQHCRMEPNTLAPGHAVINETHRLLSSPKLIHYKYANWARWQETGLSRMPKYRAILDNTRIVDVPAEWHWPFAIPELNHG